MSFTGNYDILLRKYLCYRPKNNWMQIKEIPANFRNCTHYGILPRFKQFAKKKIFKVVGVNSEK